MSDTLEPFATARHGFCAMAVGSNENWGMQRTIHHCSCHVLLALSTLWSCRTAEAQNPWLNVSSGWHETYAYFDGSYLHHAEFDIMIDGDTVINGQDHHRLRRTGTDTLWAIGDTAPAAILLLDQYLGALREDPVQEQWWVVFAGFLNAELLYDFDLIEGQVLSGTFGDCSENYVVGPVDSVQIGTSWRRRFHFHASDRYIIEGVGMSSGLFGYLCPFIEEFGCLISYSTGPDVLSVDGCEPLALSLLEPTRVAVAAPFPNPVVDQCVLGPEAAGQMVLVQDATGRIVERDRAGSRGEIDLNALPPGTYLLRHSGRCHRVVKW